MRLWQDVIAGLGNANKRLVVRCPLDSIVHHLPVSRYAVNVQEANNVRDTVVHDVVHPLTVRSLLQGVAHLQPQMAAHITVGFQHVNMGVGPR